MQLIHPLEFRHWALGRKKDLDRSEGALELGQGTFDDQIDQEEGMDEK